ncbi:MAG: hypothetical protein H7839_00620 [Magnetococcus sp. YQC-5]
MEDFSNEDKTERSEPPAKNRSDVQASGHNQGKIISIVVGILVLLIVLFQISSMSQQKMVAIELEKKQVRYKQQMEFRDKALQRRFDTIENNKQADMLESRFKSAGQTFSSHEQNTSPTE